MEDILEPIQSRLPVLAAELSTEGYWNRVGELVRVQIIEAVAQHLIWNKARSQLSDSVKPQLEKAVAKMEKDRINREFGGRETLYEKYLARHGMSRDDIRERLRRNVLIDSYLRDRLLPMIPPPRKTELLEYYQTHRESFSQPERREMFLIDIPVAALLEVTPPITRHEEEKADAKARTMIDQAAIALAGGRPFEEVAREYSKGLHTEAGGYWGFITAPSGGQSSALQGRWEAPSRRLFELEEGAHSEILQSVRSYFIVKAGRIEPGKQQTFQEAQPDIAALLRQQRFNKLRANFLQKQLEQSTLGSLEEFVSAVMSAVPGPADARASIQTEKDATPARSPPLKINKSFRP